MKTRSATLRLMIMDACVLIDCIKTDPSVLRLIAEYVGPIHVVSAVVEEVNQVEKEEDLIEFGLIVVEVEMEDAYPANIRHPALGRVACPVPRHDRRISSGRRADIGMPPMSWHSFWH